MGETAKKLAPLEQWPAISVEKAKEFDYILLVDQSGSMSEPSTVIEGSTKWKEAQEFTEAFARFAETVDDDGITLGKFSSTVTMYDGVKADAVHQLFASNSPHGGTNLAAALDAAFAKKFASSKKAVIVVITDGSPDNKTNVDASVIKAASKIEDDTQLNVLIVQIGNDPGATAFLDHLDNGLSGAKYDIVNTLDAATAGTLSMEQLVFQAVNH